MAKLSLLFLAVFCIIQVCYSARIVRDAPPTDSSDQLTKAIEDSLKSFKTQLDETFTQENLNKISDQLKQLGDKIVATSSDLLQKANEQAEQLKNN